MFRFIIIITTVVSSNKKKKNGLSSFGQSIKQNMWDSTGEAGEVGHLGHYPILLDKCVLLNYYNFKISVIYLNGNASG